MKRGPAWVRSAIVDPETLEPLPAGHQGLLRHYDLANLFSVSAIQTEDHAVARGNGFELLKRRAVLYGLAGCGAFFMGQFTLFTYVRPFLESVTQVDVPTLSLLLLLVGVMGVLGTALIGSLLRFHLHGTLMVVPVLMAGVALALIPLGAELVPVALLLGLWGLMATANPVGWWSWVAQTMPDDAEAGGGLMVAVVQLAIALGSTLGGELFDARGLASTFAASAIVLLVGAWLTFEASRTRWRQAA